MSNRRRIPSQPDHECDRKPVTALVDMQCACGHCETGEREMRFCCSAESNRWLADHGAETQMACPVCGCCCTLTLRIGREWLGEPRFIWECSYGCSPDAIRAAMLERGVRPGCLGEYATAASPALPAAFSRWN